MTIQNQENSKNDSILGTIKLLGDKTLIKLDKADSHTISDGIIIPMFTHGETEGGRPKSTVSDRKLLSVGTVLLTTSDTLKPGDRVTVHPTTVNAHYFYALDRYALIQEFDGTILVPNNMVESIYNYEKQDNENH